MHVSTTPSTTIRNFPLASLELNLPLLLVADVATVRLEASDIASDRAISCNALGFSANSSSNSFPQEKSLEYVLYGRAVSVV